MVGGAFMVLALVFFTLAMRDRLSPQSARVASRRAWLRVAIIFAGVGILLIAVHSYFR